MNQPPPSPSADELLRAQETIARQADEITALQQQLGREHFAQELRQLLISASTFNILLSPFTYSRLLEMVVETAAQVIQARAGSLFLIDQESQDLFFEVAIGPKAQEVKRFRVPIGHGIAGLVAQTGQPMAIANAPQDERVAIDIASSIKYAPESILCVPLFYDDQVIGALELLDKIGATSFNPADMQTLGLFAHMAAVAIAQSRSYHDQKAVLNTLIRSFSEVDPERRQKLYREVEVFASWMDKGDATTARARHLATLVNELVAYGEEEYTMCVNILHSFVENLRRRQVNYDFAVPGNGQKRGF